MELSTEAARRLIAEQFPQWKQLPIRPVAKSGHDNRTFHLGDRMAVRLPSAARYASQAEKELRWLPYLQQHLDYPISHPVAAGKPTAYYPFPWSVNRWIEGDTLLSSSGVDQVRLAGELASALRQLQAVDCREGPKAGHQNFYRGGELTVYHAQTQEALHALREELPAQELGRIWERCIAQPYTGPAVWVHGDVAPGNILLRDGRFYALIDFGVLGTGDPACDYAMAWSYFAEPARGVFLDGLPRSMVNRARGWALWKALITYHDENPDFRENARYTLRAILTEQD